MKKGTIIVLLITLMYCLLATYILLFEVGYDLNIVEPIFPLWLENFLLVGGVLGLILGLNFGYIGLFFGQIITFLILFFILKTLINWLIYEFEKSKT